LAKVAATRPLRPALPAWKRFGLLAVVLGSVLGAEAQAGWDRAKARAGGPLSQAGLPQQA